MLVFERCQIPMHGQIFLTAGSSRRNKRPKKPAPINYKCKQSFIFYFDHKRTGPRFVFINIFPARIEMVGSFLAS